MRERLRQDLTVAMKARDTTAVKALRSAVAAIENAEAVEAQPEGTTTSCHVARASLGVGSSEVERRSLTDDDVRAVLIAERDERLASAKELDAHGRTEHAEELRTEAEILSRYTM